jgi:Transcription factor S-II (TFIIS), central domain
MPNKSSILSLKRIPNLTSLADLLPLASTSKHLHCLERQESSNPLSRERFRMLDFNLRKPDRIILHKRIVSSTIAPEALSLMSSTDLASEEEKQSIKLAEQESLAHSILHKPTAPRAKITHKGLQDIEDVNGELVGRRDTELDREQEEEERRDRERMARLRAAGASGSAPPESPVITDNPPWGAPPPVPLHALQQDHPANPLTHPERPTLNPLFFNSASGSAVQHQVVEGELNLADLINIDEDTSQEIGVAEPSVTPVQENFSPVTTTTDEKKYSVGESPSPTSPTSPSTGISPFAVNLSKPDTTTRPSFDLSSVWSAPKAPDDKPPPSPPALPAPEEPKDPTADVAFLGEEADDKDFDMFLEKDDNEAGPSSEGPRKRPGFDDFPQVWKGSVS